MAQMALERIRNHDPTLNELNLTTNRITDIEAQHIATALQYNSTLTQVSLYGNRISDSLRKETREHALEKSYQRNPKNMHPIQSFIAIGSEIKKKKSVFVLFFVVLNLMVHRIR